MINAMWVTFWENSELISVQSSENRFASLYEEEEEIQPVKKEVKVEKKGRVNEKRFDCTSAFIQQCWKYPSWKA